MDDILLHHFEDLARRAERTGRFQFTSFLSLGEQSLLRPRRDMGCVTFFGGAEGTERCMARFGDPEEMGYEEPFPITLLEIAPLQKRFAESLTHRDFLGSLMNLGTQREVFGDIVLRDSSAFLFVSSSMADYVSGNLTRVRNTSVFCKKADHLPEGGLFRTKEETLFCASLRLDCLLCAAFDLSRSSCATLFSEQKVFLNGILCENSSREACENDVLSLRGYGRFIFRGVSGKTRKGRDCVTIERYI